MHVENYSQIKCIGKCFNKFMADVETRIISSLFTNSYAVTLSTHLALLKVLCNMQFTSACPLKPGTVLEYIRILSLYEE